MANDQHATSSVQKQYSTILPCSRSCLGILQFRNRIERGLAVLGNNAPLR